jgi:hypothetical protein
MQERKRLSRARNGALTPIETSAAKFAVMHNTTLIQRCGMVSA